MKYSTLCSGRWMVTFILCVGMMVHANAQTFTDRVQKKEGGKGTVTLHQSSEIEQLLNDPTATDVQQQPTKPTPPAQPSQQSQPSQKPQPSQKSQQPQQKPTTADVDVTPQKPTGARKVIGYRVQAYAGGNSRKDRQAAEQACNNIKAQIPGVAVDVHFYSPRWICRVGNFRTYEEAHQMMVKLQNMGYTQATIVKGKITVAY